MEDKIDILEKNVDELQEIVDGLTVIDKLASKTPELVKNFEQLQMEELLLFCKKNLDYGTRNITKGLDMSKDANVWFIAVSLWTRISDKINRWQTALLNGESMQVKDESILDTLQDISNYCNIAQLIYRGMWKE